MPLSDHLVAELGQEAAATRRVLERVPADRLTWKPHDKSMSLGQLALHIAGLPGAIAELVREPVRELPNVPLHEARDVSEILTTLERSVEQARTALAGWTDEQLAETYTLTRNGQPVVQGPRLGMVRAIMLNHWYHHRGQLTVYLRLNGVPVPSIYGPSADENPGA